MYHLGGSFTQLMQQRHATHPSSPTKVWDLIIYCDEIVPGNVLGRAERKAWAVYASFLNFQEELHNQDLWLTMALERSTFISTVEGGIAQVMAKLVESPSWNTHETFPRGHQVAFPVEHNVGRWCSP